MSEPNVLDEALRVIAVLVRRGEPVEVCLRDGDVLGTLRVVSAPTADEAVSELTGTDDRILETLQILHEALLVEQMIDRGDAPLGLVEVGPASRRTARKYSGIR
jgi:hypothetical protein